MVVGGVPHHKRPVGFWGQNPLRRLPGQRTPVPTMLTNNRYKVLGDWARMSFRYSRNFLEKLFTYIANRYSLFFLLNRYLCIIILYIVACFQVNSNFIQIFQISIFFCLRLIKNIKQWFSDQLTIFRYIEEIKGPGYASTSNYYAIYHQFNYHIGNVGTTLLIHK